MNGALAVSRRNPKAPKLLSRSLEVSRQFGQGAFLLVIDGAEVFPPWWLVDRACKIFPRIFFFELQALTSKQGLD